MPADTGPWDAPTWLRIIPVVWGVLGGALCAALGREEVWEAIDLTGYRPWAQAFFAPQVALSAIAGGAYCRGLLVPILRKAHKPSTVLWAFLLTSTVPLLVLLILMWVWGQLAGSGFVPAPGPEVMNSLFGAMVGTVWAIPFGAISGAVFYAGVRLTARSTGGAR
jgi:hypothetical protein